MQAAKWYGTLERMGADLESDSQEREVQLLNGFLANQLLLRSKMRNYRWNFRETPHHDLEQILKSHGRELDRIIEEVVHRIKRMGGSVNGSLTEVLRAADLIADESAHGILPHDAVTRLAVAHQTISGKLKKNTSGTSRELCQLLQQWSMQHEEMSVALKAIGSNRLHLH